MEIEAVAVRIGERSQDADTGEQQGTAEQPQNIGPASGLGLSQCLRQIPGGMRGENDDAREETGMHIGPNHK